MFTPYQDETDQRMAASARRLQMFLKTAPNVKPLVESECNLMVRAIARRLGTEAIREWLDQILDETIEDLIEYEPVAEGGSSRP